MKRRRFLGWAIFGSIVSFVVQGCRNILSAQTDNLKNQDFTAIGTITQLKQEGQILKEDSEVGAVLIRYDRDSSLVAIDPTCTHAGCTVGWEQKENGFVCPCHGSKFNPQGEVISGLANFPLPTYQVKTEGDTILVKPMNNE
jgi:cytochrome b6-f complex iron-sulfur subunit